MSSSLPQIKQVITDITVKNTDYTLNIRLQQMQQKLDFSKE